MPERLESAADGELPPAVQKYIQHAAGGIRSRRRRRDVERELRAHALEVFDELQAGGMCNNEAAVEITRRLGDVMNLNELLGAANRTPLQRWLMWISAAALTLAAGGVTVALAVKAVEMKEREREVSEAMRGIHPVFVKAQTEWSKEPLFAPPHGQKDIGEVLNGRFQWDDSDANSFGVTTDLRDRIQKALEKIDFEALKKMDVSGLDSSWMSSLKGYDYWELYSGEKGKQKLAESLAEKRFIPKGPDIIPLMTVARARFVQGVQRGEVRAALTEVDELARLLMTTENLLAFQIGITIRYSMLPQWEKAAFDGGLLKGQARYTAVEDRNYRFAGRNLYYLLSNYLTPEEYLEEFARHPEWNVGRCAAVNEMLYSMHAVDAYLKPAAWPLEWDFARVVRLRQAILDQSKDKCRLTWSRAGGFEVANMKVSNFSISGGNALMELIASATAHLPYARRLVGLSINGVLTGIP